MSTPTELANTLVQTDQFLESLLTTPRLPKYVRERAHQLLRHYPIDIVSVSDALAGLHALRDARAPPVPTGEDGKLFIIFEHQGRWILASPWLLTADGQHWYRHTIWEAYTQERVNMLDLCQRLNGFLRTDGMGQHE